MNEERAKAPAPDFAGGPMAPDRDAPVDVVDVQFRAGSKIYYFAPGDLTVAAGDHVIIETARGPEYGTCTGGNHQVPFRDIVPPLRRVIRLATEADHRVLANNQVKEKRAFDICQQKIQEHKLDMQLVSAEYAFDGSKILFFFTADDRVDFRELVKNLAGIFRTRIELRQIGVRDKAKMVGGLGICGRPFCCAQFLDDFQPVSIKMAKTQNLSLNPTKISGTCGRLMCCLKYEQEAYEDLIKTAPKAESFVDTPDGRGTVIEVNLLRQSVKVRMEDHPETIGSYKNTDIYIIRNGKARKNDPPIPKDLAPISSRPRPAQKKKEAFFEELPEVIYSDAVAVISPEPETPAEDAAAQPSADAAKSGARRRRRGGRRSKPAAERPAGEAAAAPKDAPRAEPQPRRERPKKDRAPQIEKPDAQPRKPAAQQQPRPDKPEVADAQAKRRRRRRGGSRKPAGESQPQKSE